MSLQEGLFWASRAGLVLVAVLAFVEFARRADVVRRDAALMLGALAIGILAGQLENLVRQPIPGAATAGAAFILAHPYLLLRLATLFRPAPKMVSIAALAGMLGAWAIVAVIPAPLPLSITLALVGYFALVEGYAATRLLRGALGSSGVASRRMGLAAAGSLGLAGAVLLAGAQRLAPDIAVFTSPATEVLVLGSAVGYYLAFSTPAWLRDLWHLRALAHFLQEVRRVPPGEQHLAALREACVVATRSTAAVGAVAMLADDGDGKLVPRASDKPTLLQVTISGQAGATGRALREGQPAREDNSDAMEPEEAALCRAVGARGLLAVPIRGRERSWGLLLVYLTDARLFGEDDLELLVTLAEQCAGSLEHAALLEQERKVTHQLEASNRDLAGSQSRFQALFDTAPDGVISADRSGSIVLMNRAAERMFGYPAGEAIGRPLTILMPQRFHDAHRAGFERFLATGEARVVGRTVELVGWNKSGGEFPVELSLTHWTAGGADFFTGVARDITERKLAEQAIAERTAQMEAVNQELEAFAYSVSHDLRAPLRAIHGFSRILMEDYQPELPAECVRYLELVQENARQMGRLVDDLLSYSRLGRQPITKQEVALLPLVQQVLDELAPVREGRRVEVQIHQLPRCHGDPVLLKQLWLNLLDNALKYTRPRDPAWIEVGWLEGDSGTPVYYVKDNGVGFDMRYAEQLFGVFQRLHLQEEYEGTGVGLAIVQRIVHRHGGRVWAEAVVNKGAAFYFTLE